ncbi:hypothetical protein C1645_834938 [Glomus cerebriforme]|uniref:BTB/POZ domain-containing protein n=1 Tax=Glomus cerebriforme TaxID=658196 RepID=A0A397S9S0_9GLOM|nr:hypothetical protein C1645_834938 [Glomus cerebriforme]
MTNTLKNYAKILEESDEYDLIIKIGQEPDLKIFNAHSIILRAQSSYFHRALSREWRREENGKILFEKPNVSSKVFDYILKYLYSGDIISLNNFDYGELTDVIIAADEFILPDLITYIEKRLLLSFNQWLTKNFVKIYKFVTRQEFCKELQEFCYKNFYEKPSIILKSEDFILLDEEMMITFLRLEDHDMKEIDVWNHLKQWGMAQNPTINFDGNPRTWNEENFLRLKETLSQCITHIQFSSITTDEFRDHIRPFKQIFPDDYYEEILWNYISNDGPKTYSSLFTKSTKSAKSKTTESYNYDFPKLGEIIQNLNQTNLSNTVNIDSEIIGDNHISLISRWINETTNKTCHSFDLIANSKIDGFSSQTFSRKCDDIRSTLVILTVEGTNEILGGFNPLRWGSKGECWKSTNESFIFSFPNGQDHTNYRLSLVNPICEKKAIYRSGFNGPNFGGGDLTMGRSYSLKRDCLCIQTNYMLQIRNDTDYFRCGSYEIFEVHFY